MEKPESYPKLWNKQQAECRRTLLSFSQHDKAIPLVLRQHALLHAARMAQTEAWSFEDEVLNDMTEAQIRRIPRHREHSVAWILWHLARIEDVALNLLVAGSPQILQRDNWLERLKVDLVHTGNAMDAAAMAKLSATIDMEALRDYRVAVGRRTREIITQLEPQALKQKVQAERLQQVRAEGAVVEAADGILDYWGRRNIAGLLLMPATRHNFIHLNEALRLKQARR
jgi:hypothetical protein